MSTTTPFATDGNTYTLHLLDGTVGSAGKVDNAEGTAARDLVENGTLTAGTDQTTPTSDGTYNGFGANKNLQITDANLSGWPTGDQTHQFWVKPSALPSVSGLAFIMSKQGATAGTYFGIDNTGAPIGRVSDGTTTKDWTGTSTMSTGNWYYLVVVFVASTSLNVYLNAVNIYSSAAGIPANARKTGDDFFLATQNNVKADATFSWAGDIGSYMFSSTAMSAGAIDAYYNPASATASASPLMMMGV